MDYYNGKENKKRVLRWFVSSDKVSDAQVPEISETQAYKSYKANANIASTNGFMNIPQDIEDDELPFN